MMKRVSFVLLSGFIFYLSAHSVYGKLSFLCSNLLFSVENETSYLCAKFANLGFFQMYSLQEERAL